MRYILFFFAAVASLAQTYTSPVVSDLTHASAKFAWTTSTSVNTYVKFGTTGAYGLFKDCNISGTAHECYASGLAPSTLYHYALCSATGSCEGVDRTFTTLALPSPHPALPTAPAAAPLPANPTTWETDVLVTSCAGIQTAINTAATLNGNNNQRIRVPVSYDCAPGVPSGEGWGNTSPLLIPAKSGSNPSGTGLIVLEPDWSGADVLPEGIRVSSSLLPRMPILRMPPFMIESNATPTTGTCQLGRLYWDYTVTGWGLKACTTPASNTYTLVAKTDFSGSSTACASPNSWYNKTDAVSDDASLYWCGAGVLYRLHFGSAAACSSTGGAVCFAAGAHHFRINGFRFLPVPIWTGVAVPQWLRDLYTAHFSFWSILFDASNAGVHDIVIDRSYISLQFPYRVRNVFYGRAAGLRFTNNYVEADFHTPTYDDAFGYNPGTISAVQMVGGGGALIDNNYMDVSGIVVFGGDDIVESNDDVTVTRNTIRNPAKHIGGHADNVTYCGGVACWFASRHLTEIKFGQRWKIDGNIFSEHFTSGNNQADAITLSSRPGTGHFPISDVSITNNRFDRIPNLVTVQGHNDNLSSPQAAAIARVQIDSNVIFDLDGARFASGASSRQGRAFFVYLGAEDISITRNLVRNNCTGYAPWFVWEEAGPSEGLVVQNNIAWSCDLSAGSWKYMGSNGNGQGITGLNAGFPGPSWVATHNAIVEAGGGLTSGSGYPTGNYFTTPTLLAFTNLAGNDYRLTGASPFRAAASTVTNVSGPSSTSADLGPDFTLQPVGITLLSATPVAVGLTLAYTAPSIAACYVDTSTAADFTGATRTADAGGAVSRSVPVTGLAAVTLYYYRVLCDRDTLTGSATTLAASSAAPSVRISGGARMMGGSGGLGTFVAQPVYTYYVDPAGSDAAAGSLAAPWATIAKVNATSLTPGQSVGFKRGSTWRETLTVPSSGSAGSPITFGAYGNGAAPIVSAGALDDGTGWTQTYTDVTSTAYLTNSFQSFNLGNTDSQMRNAQSFTIPTAGSVSRIDLWGYRRTTGTTDTLLVDLYGDTSAKPGTLLGTSQAIAASTLTTSSTGQLEPFVFTTPIALSASTQYWIVVRRSTETVDATNFYSFGGFNTSGFAGGGRTTWTKTTTTWATVSAIGDLYFQIYTQGSLTPVWYKTVATMPRVLAVDAAVANHRSALSELIGNTDWWWDSAYTRLFLYTATAPSGRAIELSARDYVIDSNGKNYITVSGLSPRYAKLFDVRRGVSAALSLQNLSMLEGSQIELGRVITGSALDASGNIFANDIQNFSGNKGVIVKSTDGGTTWTNLKQFSAGTQGLSLFVAANGNLFQSPYGFGFSVGGDQGIWRSTDAGSTWTKVETLASYGADTAVIWGWAEDSTGRLFAGMYGTGTQHEANILRSTDGGATWSGVFNDAAGRHIHDVKVDLATDYIYATMGDDFTPFFTRKIMRSTDHGDTWSEILAAAIPTTALGILCTPTSRLFTQDGAGGGVYRTTNDSTATQTLNLQAVGLNLYGFWIRRNPVSGYVYAGFISSESTTAVSRIYQSKDDGVTWIRLVDYVVSGGGYAGPSFVSNLVGNRIVMQYDAGAGNVSGIILGTP